MNYVFHAVGSKARESLRQEIVDYLQDRGDYAGFSEWAEGERNDTEQQDIFSLELLFT
jgi:hypothetical protein